MTIWIDDTENEDQDALADEWAAMLDDDDEDSEGSSDEVSSTIDSLNNDRNRLGRVLDQDEIDSLLGFDDDNASEYQNGIEAIVNSALVSYERLPMLEVIYDRLIRLLNTSLRNFTSDNVDISIENMTAVRFGDYLNSVPLPAMLSVFKAEEWDNYGLIVIDSSLIYSIVDILLGGRRGESTMAVEGRPYTTIELTLMERMINLILADLSAAFDPLSHVTFRFDRVETNPRFAAIARAANTCILTKFRVDMEGRGGIIELIIPYATLEPVRDLLLQMFLGEKFGQDQIWESHLATNLWNTNVPVRAVLDEFHLSLSDVLDWKVGSQIMLNASEKSKVKLRCGNIDTFSGVMGKSKDKVAIKVEKSLTDLKKGIAKNELKPVD